MQIIIIMSIRWIMWSLCIEKYFYVYYVDYVRFMLIVYIMYFRDIPNLHNVFIIHKAFP